MPKLRTLLTVAVAVAVAVCAAGSAAPTTLAASTESTVTPVTGPSTSVAARTVLVPRFTKAGNWLPWLTDHVGHTCTGDGSTGNRVQALYVRTESRPSRLEEHRATFERELLLVDDVLAASAAQTGGGLAVRWVHDADCRPVVTEVVVPDGSLLADGTPIPSAALSAAGHDRADRVYLTFTDPVTPQMCGVSWHRNDSSPAGNVSDTGPGFARVDTACWETSGYHDSASAHELAHALGAVPYDAPNGTGHGHCDDGHDTLCYRDVPGVQVTSRCPAPHGKLFDCGGDDYLNLNPPAGSWIAEHWNLANSSFLQRVPALPPAPEPRIRFRERRDQTLVVSSPDRAVLNVSGGLGCVPLSSRLGVEVRFTCAVRKGTVVKFKVWLQGDSPLRSYTEVGHRMRKAALRLRGPERIRVGEPVLFRARMSGPHRKRFDWRVPRACAVRVVRSTGTAERAVVTCRRPARRADVKVTARTRWFGTWRTRVPVRVRPARR